MKYMGTLTSVAKHIPINADARSPFLGARQPMRITNIAIPADQSRGADMPAPTNPQKIGGPKLKKKRNGSAIFGISTLSRSRRVPLCHKFFKVKLPPRPRPDTRDAQHQG